MEEDITVRIDGNTVRPAMGEDDEMAAINMAAGAVLAGAAEVQIIRQNQAMISKRDD